MIEPERWKHDYHACDLKIAVLLPDAGADISASSSVCLRSSLTGIHGKLGPEKR